MDDERIIRLFEQRDEAALREAERKYGRYCYTIARRILASHEDAEECVNDTWMGAWRAIPPEKPGVLSGFLARITRNIAIDRLRHDHAQKRGATLQESIEEYWECIPDPEASIEDEYVMKQAINGFLAGLDARTRVIFMRRYWYAMSVKEIARGMELSESHVSVILHRTRAEMKAYLTKEGVFV